LDEKTVKKIRRKHRTWQRYMETRDGKKYQEYAKLRNHFKNAVKKAKMSMERDIHVAGDVEKNPKKFWKYANSKRKAKYGISELKTNTENGVKTTENDGDKAEVLAEFFGSAFIKEPEGEIPNFQHKEIKSRCAEHQIEEKEVLKLLLDINPNKSPWPDGIHPKALKETAAILAKPLTKICNASLQSGIVPDLWKLWNIIALFIKGDKSDPGNYRPVSLTSVVGKLMEKIVREVIVGHMIQNKLFSDKNFGFISGRSTTLQLLIVIETTELH
jgi:hypothetical protein